VDVCDHVVERNRSVFVVIEQDAQGLGVAAEGGVGRIVTEISDLGHPLRQAQGPFAFAQRGLGSTAALYPSVSAVYGGSKAAVAMIARNLRLELRGTGLRVTDVRPGRVRTEFYDAAIGDPAAAARAKDTGILDLSPADVAAAVLYAVEAPPHVNVSAIELQPVEQTYGGVFFDPVPEERG